MKKILGLVQFLPLSVFLYVASSGQSDSAVWQRAFEFGAAVATLEFLILIPILKTELSRLITAVNLFLLIGGIGFYFNLVPVMNALGFLRESSLFLCVSLVAILATWLTPAGVFEKKISASGREKAYSICFIICSLLVFAVSFYMQGNVTHAGVLPFLFLICLKWGLEVKMHREQ